MLTVQSLLDELDLDLAAGERGRRGAGALGPHLRARGPDPVALRRRADADHRHPARQRRQAALLRPPARRAATSPGSASAPGSATTNCRKRWSRRPRNATSRSSRCPTRRRSSRSPRRPSPGSSTSSTRCCSAASPCSAGSSGWSSRSAAWRRSRRRSPPRSAAPSAILDGRGERLAGRGFRRQLSADAIGGDPQRGARPRRRRPPLRPRPPLGRRPGARPPGDLARRRAAAGLGGDRPRLRRPRRLRAADPAAGGRRRRARADAPPGRP